MPTPQTLRVFQMFDQRQEEQVILQYITNNSARINVNHNHPELETMLNQAILKNYTKVMKKLLDLGATITNDIRNELVSAEFAFLPPVAKAIELMNVLLNAGISKEDMLHILTRSISGTHKELLKTLLEQPLNINEEDDDGVPALHILILTFSDETKNIRGVFMEMLQLLIQKGADPNKVDANGSTAIQLVNEFLNERNPGPILQILQSAPASAAPAAPTAPDYKKLWEEELQKSKPDIAKLEEYKTAGNIDVNAALSFEYDGSLVFRMKRDSEFTLIEALLKWGANPNKMHSFGEPIFWRLFNRNVKKVKPWLLLFINYGADIKIISSASDIYGAKKTCLMHFIESIWDFNVDYIENIKEIVDMLIANGVDIHYRNNYGDVLDKVILIFRSLDLSRYFLEKGMSVIVDGRTRLYKSLTYSRSIEYVKNILDLFLKYHTNKSDYYRDLLDYVIKEHYNDEMYIPLEDKLAPNFNEVFVDGSTPLIKAAQIPIKNPDRLIWIKSIIQRMLENGADPNYKDPAGKKAMDYTTNEELQELLGKPKELWKGWSRSDVAFLNEIFTEEQRTSNSITVSKATDYSLCPVCLKTVERPQGCMHMKHDCATEGGFYHKELYAKYKTDGYIHWCTICNRIGWARGSNFLHYKLGLAEDSVPKKADASYLFDADCSTRSGGGGLLEKYKRFNRLRNVALQYNNPSSIGKKSQTEVLNKLTEAMWNAPLLYSTLSENQWAKQLAEKRWNAPNTNFAPPATNAAAAAPTPAAPVNTNVPVPNAVQDPIVHPTTTEKFANFFATNDTNIIQFRHPDSTGVMRLHDKPGQQISQGMFAQWLNELLGNPATDERFGHCWQFKENEYGANRCTAKLYPKEVRIALGLAEKPTEGENAEYRQLYKNYRMLFNRKERGQLGGQRSRNKTRRRKTSKSKTCRKLTNARH